MEWLDSPNQYKASRATRNFILDNTGLISARILASGMMNGITSPGRPWFRLGIVGRPQETLSNESRAWLEDTQRRLSHIMSTSNFYNSMAVLFLELVIFGSAAMLIYEDEDNIIHCHNSTIGEFYFIQDSRQCGS
jgi:hypothetical protein